MITYTERAAGELRARIRERLLEIDRPDLARDIDRAWISTIHGFCNRLLKSHPFEAGLDPGFRVLDESQSRVLRSEAFTEALAAFCAGRDPARLALLATYGSRRLPSCSAASTSASARPVARSSSARSRRAGSPRPWPRSPSARRRRSTRCPATSWPAPSWSSRASWPPDRLRPPTSSSTSRSCARTSSSSRSSRSARRSTRSRAPRSTRSPGATGSCSRSCSSDSTRRSGEAKARESGVDFEDLQLFARDLLRGERRGPRADEVALPLRARGRVPGHEPAPVRARRRARRGGAVLRRGRVPVDLPLPPRRRRGVPRAPRGERGRARADAELPLAAGGARGREPALRHGVRHRLRAARGRRARSRSRSSGRASSCSSRTSRATRARGSTGARRRRSTSRAACASWWTRARRRRARSCSSSPRARTPSATRRRCAPRACRPIAPPDAATSASSRSPT